MNTIYEKRIDCWQDTLNISKQLKSPPESIKTKYQNDYEFCKKHKKTNIKFFDMDSIDCCLEHAPNALVLNLADDIFPGGCVRQGSGAQEEALFRRTNYNSSLKQKFYPIKYGEAVYSSEITVFKTDESSGWKLLEVDKRPNISFIACPGIKYPDTLLINGEMYLDNTDIEFLKIQIKTIIQTAITYKHDTIIFGALGCGAWQCPAKHVAQIFKEVLQLYDGSILNFYFAILNTADEKHRNSRSNNQKPTVDIFRTIFEDIPVL